MYRTCVCALEAKLFGLGLVVSVLVLGLEASGLGLTETGLEASKIYSIHGIN